MPHMTGDQLILHAQSLSPLSYILAITAGYGSLSFKAGKAGPDAYLEKLSVSYEEMLHTAKRGWLEGERRRAHLENELAPAFLKKAHWRWVDRFKDRTGRTPAAYRRCQIRAKAVALMTRFPEMTIGEVAILMDLSCTQLLKEMLTPLLPFLPTHKKQ